MNHFGTSGRKEKRLMKREVKEELEGENLVCVGGERERKGGRRKTRGWKALSPCLEGVAGWFSRLKRERGWNKIGSL